MSRRGPRRVAFAALALLCLAVVVALFQPFAGNGGDPVRVQVPKAAGVSDIADLLEQRGVVSSSTLFEVRATLAGDRGNLKPGSYELREDMPYGDVLDRLTAGPSQEIVRVTIPEGLSRREITPLVARAGVNGNYLRASASTSLIDGRGYAVPAGAESLEGFLFPATYELRGGAQAAALVRRQITAFEQNMSRVDLAYARGKNLTVYDVVTIASMIEREVQVARERRLVAAVIYNRLKAGQPLGIDATIRYATGNWTQPLKQSELAIDSGYNTRTRAGLPPGPIGNPGLASLQAAARPARVGYLFYVVKPGTCGEHAFSSTDAEFARDQQRYNEARDAAGGKSPTNMLASSESRCWAIPSGTAARRPCTTPPSASSVSTGAMRHSTSSRRGSPACSSPFPGRGSWAPTSRFPTSCARWRRQTIRPRSPGWWGPPTRCPSGAGECWPTTPTSRAS